MSCITLKTDAEKNNSIKVKDHVQHAMFTLLVFMCFGGEVQKEKIEDIEHVQRCLMSELSRFGVLNLLPGVVTRVLLRKRWQELLDLRQAQKDVFTQLIKTIKNASTISL